MNFFVFSFKIYLVQYRIPKFETSGVKSNDFTSLQSWALCPPKWPREWIELIQKYHAMTSLCTKLLFAWSKFLVSRECSCEEHVEWFRNERFVRKIQQSRGRRNWRTIFGTKMMSEVVLTWYFDHGIQIPLIFEGKMVQLWSLVKIFTFITSHLKLCSHVFYKVNFKTKHKKFTSHAL